VRWTVPGGESEGGPPALAPDGRLRATGILTASTIAPTLRDNSLAVFAVAPQGQLAWTLWALPWSTDLPQLPFSKGVAPLVTASNLLYMPVVGPSKVGAGVAVISPAGRPLRRVLANFSPYAFALARDGQVYGLGSDSQNRPRLEADSGDGRLRWSRAMTGTAVGGVLIGRSGSVYASDGTGFGPQDTGELVAYTPAGRLLWQLHTAGAATLGERGDGTLLVATGMGLSAVSPRGTYFWQRALRHAPAAVYAGAIHGPSLAIDAAGRAYIGTADGLVRAVAPDGTLLWTIRAGPPSDTPPSCILGPRGQLVIAEEGTVPSSAGILRVYH
jgi:hypothetical protein